MGKIERHDGVKGVVAEQQGGPATRPPGPQSIEFSAPLAAERLTIELARLRAKFGADPAIARASFDDAWMSPTAAMEEDEAEFIDAVADCLGVGLSLDAALTCWDSGGLFYDDDQEADADAEEAGDDAAPAAVAAAQHHAHPTAHPTGRRLVVQ